MFVKQCIAAVLIGLLIPSCYTARTKPKPLPERIDVDAALIKMPDKALVPTVQQLAVTNLNVGPFFFAGYEAVQVEMEMVPSASYQEFRICSEKPKDATEEPGCRMHKGIENVMQFSGLGSGVSRFAARHCVYLDKKAEQVRCGEWSEKLYLVKDQTW